MIYGESGCLMVNYDLSLNGEVEVITVTKRANDETHGLIVLNTFIGRQA